MTTTVNDKPREECAVMGVYNQPQAANFVYLGLYSLQHRGQESSGIVTNDKGTFHKHIDMGLVADVFSKKADMEKLVGNMAIGHNRYSTTGMVKKVNAQPLVVSSRYGPLSISHNGNFVNSRALRQELEDEGAIFQTTTDTEIVLHLIARSKKNKMSEKVVDSLDQIQGAFSLVLMTQKKLIGARDPWGFRPLCIGKKENSYIIIGFFRNYTFNNINRRFFPQSTYLKISCCNSIHIIRNGNNVI